MGKSLAEKLGIKSGYILFQNFDGDYIQLIGAGNIDFKLVNYPDEQRVDIIHLFCFDLRDAQTGILEYKNHIKLLALESGLVDVKVCSINGVWSALKLVYRKKVRF
jgi:hypothetical protein